MRKFLLALSFAGLFLSASQLMAEPIGGGPIIGEPTVGRGVDISVLYLEQARAYRNSGRYELSRQSYAQALSTCRNEANLEIIKRELAGIELLIRTMR